jgi:hypothetical protein
VVSHEFFFALEFSSQGAPASLVEDLAGEVLRHTGCSPASVPGLSEACSRAAAASGAAGHPRCDVQFRAHDGKLDILVSSNGGRVWQETLPIP